MYIRKTFPAFPFSPATATAERNGKTATEWWKPGINVRATETLCHTAYIVDMCTVKDFINWLRQLWGDFQLFNFRGH